MGIRSWLFGGRAQPAADQIDHPLIADLIAEVLEREWRYWRGPPAPELDSAAPILALAPDQRAEFVVEGISVLCRRRRAKEVYDNSCEALKQILSRLLRAHLPFESEQLVAILESLPKGRGAYVHGVPIAGVLRSVERFLEGDRELPDNLRAALTTVAEWTARHDEDADLRKAHMRISALLSPSDTSAFDVEPGPWGDEVRAWLESLDSASLMSWSDLFRHASVAAGKARPAAKWLSLSAPLLEAIGHEVFRKALSAWLEELQPGPTDAGEPNMPEKNSDLLKGLIWATAALNDEGFAHPIGSFGELCYRKVPNWGARSTKLGNACIAALGAFPDGLGVAELARLRGKVRYGSARKLISTALERAAKTSGKSREDLLELAIPSYGLDSIGTMMRQVGEFTAIVRITGTQDVELVWEKPTGRIVKSVPKAVRESDPETPKALRRLVKEIGETLGGQSRRVERLFLARRDWPIADWRERYLDHALVSNISRRLVWRFDLEDGSSRLGHHHDGMIRDVLGEGLEIDDTCRVRLWHPTESAADEVLRWRLRLEKLGIVQPFKQAHREIYLLTDAERQTGTYSNRFAAHIIRQHQFLALCQQRDWKYTIQGAWDSDNVPTRHVEGWDTVLEFWVEVAPTDEPEDGFTGFRYLSTDQLRFCDLSGQPLPLTEIDPLLLSEAMRDVDLFIAVCSVGNDPQWADRGDRLWADYWQRYSFGELSESARTRRDVLSRLVPRLKIASQCRLEERFLVVRGSRRTYRIHLGSGNIQMEPNQQYLCIVPDRSKKARDRGEVHLPFEGDSTLSLILSKAFLLAADEKIEDKTILSQIGGS